MGCEYIEMLVHPQKKSIIVRVTKADDRLAFLWLRRKNGITIPRDIGVAGIMPCIFDLFGWDYSYRYRIQGTVIEDKGIKILFFDLNDAETFIPVVSTDESDMEEQTVSISGNIKPFGTKKRVLGFPSTWAVGFGDDYYVRQAESYMRDAEYYTKKAEGYDREAEYYNKKAQGYLREADYYTRNKKYDKANTYSRWANEASDKARTQMRWANEAREKARLRMKWAQEAMEKARRR